MLRALTRGLKEHVDEQRERCQLRNVRFFLHCWCAYERHTTPRLDHPSKDADGVDDDMMERDDWEAQMDNFYEMLLLQSYDHDILTLPRRELSRALEHWVPLEEIKQFILAEPRQDLTMAFMADLQLVLPGVFLGSRVTLDHPTLIKDSHIAHQVYCSAAPPAGIDRNRADYVWTDPLIQSTTTTSHTITVVELPRIEWLQLGRNPRFRDPKDVRARTNPFEHTSEFLSTLRSTTATQDDGMLVYCDSGASVSVAIVLGFLMYRFSLVLEDAMRVVTAIRPHVAVSKDLMHLLQLYDHDLRLRRQGQRLRFHPH